MTSITPGATVTLQDTSGLALTFTAVTGAPGFQQFTIIPAVPATTIANLAAAVLATALNMTAVPVGVVVTFTQVIQGAAGNNPILSSNPLELVPVGFAGGVDRLVNFNLLSPLSPIGITIRELTVYNGDNILVVEDSESVGANDFNILDRPETIQIPYGYGVGTGVTPVSQPAAPLQHFNNEHDYKFIGFRDQPIVETNSEVYVKVEAFINAILTWATPPYPAGVPLPKIPPIPFSMNLVVDMLDDSIFGDPLVPSPASRSAANIKLGKLDLGHGELVITNAVTRDPSRS